jgi:SHS family lactate transporter-like MFS transporter
MKSSSPRRPRRIPRLDPRRGHVKGFLYLVVLMTFMMFLSHGSQDVYPDFMKERHVAANMIPLIAILYNIGAVIGAIIFGQLSQHIGRRYSVLVIVCC